MKEHERETINDTLDHQWKVRKQLENIVSALISRITEHDDQKLREPEFPRFAKVNENLSEVEYDSEEYWAQMDILDNALEHHYGWYPHHPEHFDEGIDGMSLVDLIEMLCDWKAAVDRHDTDSGIWDSIEKNQERFDISDQLRKILENTVKRHLRL